MAATPGRELQNVGLGQRWTPATVEQRPEMDPRKMQSVHPKTNKNKLREICWLLAQIQKTKSFFLISWLYLSGPRKRHGQTVPAKKTI